MFIKLKEPLPVLSRQERAREREGFKRDMRYIAYYSIFLFFMFVACLLFQESDIEKLHNEICDTNRNSPLCKDFSLLEHVDDLSSKKNVPTRLIIGIYYAESSIGTHFNKTECASYNNWAGLKGRKNDDGSVNWYTTKKGKPDKNGCWLFKFDSITEGTKSLVNTIALGYKGCNNSVRCISYNFVGHPEKAEESWINRVNKFYNI